MNNNPYAPPGAPVDDVTTSQASMPRPRQVLLAVQLAAASFIVGLLIMFLTWDYYVGLQPVGQMVATQIVTLAIMVWLYAKIYAGRNWARITLLVLTLVGMLGIFSDTAVALYKGAPVLAKVWMFIGHALSLVVLWLLFLSPGKEWFRKRAD
jgi:hypothetical protein